jgi:hypothetical protein
VVEFQGAVVEIDAVDKLSISFTRHIFLKEHREVLEDYVFHMRDILGMDPILRCGADKILRMREGRDVSQMSEGEERKKEVSIRKAFLSPL